MNVVTFYLLVAAILVSVFLFFKPMKVTVSQPGELAQIELDKFVIHEVTPETVKTILAGSQGLRYEDRYEVTDLNLTDRSKLHTENMQAAHGTYSEPMILLHDGVHYTRDDGMKFESNDLDYNRSSGLMRAPGPFVLWQKADRINGHNLVYYTKSGDMAAKKITGNYFLKDKQQ